MLEFFKGFWKGRWVARTMILSRHEKLYGFAASVHPIERGIYWVWGRKAWGRQWLG